MSKRIAEDFDALCGFLNSYNLSDFFSSPKQVELYKGIHKKIFGFLIFTTELKSHQFLVASNPFFEETASDLMLAFFCLIQGLYKPSMFQLRSSIEVFLKSLVMISCPSITTQKSVYAVFDEAIADKHFSTNIGSSIISALHSDYSCLCETAHSSPNKMQPISSLGILPRYNISSLQSIAAIFARTIENFNCIFYLNYPMLVDKMHPENKKDFLDCMAKTSKAQINQLLFS